MKTPILATCSVAVALLCLSPASGQDAGAARPARNPEANLWNCTGSPDDLPKADPAGGEVPLPKASPEWNAFHLFTSDTWRLHAIGAGHVTREDGPPEVIFMDELGRCIILTGDSGKWAPRLVVQDESSLSAWALGDLDPRVPGSELYVGGGSGKLWRVNPAARRRWVGGAAPAASGAVAPAPAPSEVVGTAEGASLSKFVLGDIDPSHPGNEMIALTNNGPVFDVRPDPASDKGLVLDKIGDLGSRCRDALLLPKTGSAPPRVAALLESGEVALLARTKSGYDRTSLGKEDGSIARLGRRPPVPGESEVVYVARIDGLIVRFEEQGDGTWKREPIFAGPNGPRGLCAGKFNADPRVETLAVFGYSKKVHLLSRAPAGKWTVETIHVDNGGGHWLTAGELDGRNTTDEIVGGGFGYHVFMLTRVPGYGFSGIAVDPDGGVVDYKLPERPPRALSLGPASDGASRERPRPATAAISPLAGGPVPGAILACDFEMDAAGSPPAGWTIGETNGKGAPAAWSTVAAKDAADGSHLLRITETRNTGGTFNLLLNEKDCPADLAIDVAIRADSGKEDQGGGVVWRAKDPANYYIARWNPLESNLRVYKVVGSVRTMFESCVLVCDPTAWHRLSIIMRGTKGAIQFDGRPCLTFEDATFPDGGKVGLWSKADAACSFDGFLVQKLSP